MAKYKDAKGNVFGPEKIESRFLAGEVIDLVGAGDAFRAGQKLVERLPVYPRDLLERPEYLDPQVREAALRFADESGYARPQHVRSRVEAA